MPVNNTEPLSVYRAGPGYAHCLAGMILSACRGHLKRGFLDDITGLAELDILALLAALAKHPGQPWGRIDNSYVALVDGVCSGMVTVREEIVRPDYPFAPGPLREAAGKLGITPEAVEAILARQRAFVEQLPAFTEPVFPGGWLVEYVSTRYENRSAGVARALMARAEADIRAAGGSALEAYCDMGNTRAERLFASLGFTLVKEYFYIPEMRPLWGEGTRRLRRLLD
jgi:GNAT superfamily N-acetyltransferase